MIPNPLMIYVVAGTLIVGAAAGYKVRDWQCDAAYAKALEKAEKQRVKMQKAVDDVSQAYEAQRDQANVVATERTNTIREIYKTAPAPLADCSAPDSVRRLLESSVSDANAAAANKSGVSVPDVAEPAKPSA
jgi:biopolymer transport protein ExbB/TolQ